MSDVKRIRFDSLCLAAIRFEAEKWVGSQIQRMWQPNDDTLIFGMYGRGQQAWLAVSIDPDFYRAHFLSAAPKKTRALTAVGRLFRTHSDSLVVQGVAQVGFDRQLILHLAGPQGKQELIFELMGKHSNVILTGEHRTILACLRPIGASRSSRPIVVGKPYQPPPGPPQPALWSVKTQDELANRQGLSPLLKQWILARAETEDLRSIILELKSRVNSQVFQPMVFSGLGAYPMDLGALGLTGNPVDSLSIGIEATLGKQAQSERFALAQRTLLGQLAKFAFAREVTLSDLNQAVDSGRNAGQVQRLGELILAYQAQITPDMARFETFDFDGEPITIPLVLDLDAAGNAKRYFDKAKKAKSGLQEVEAQRERCLADLDQVRDYVERAEQASDELVLEDITAALREKRWLQSQPETVSPGKAAKPAYDGHRIREIRGPNGYTILYGENASSNDYLTLRIGKPNDIWLHVRGSVSAHVIIQTHNQPTRVGPEVIRFAATVAARNSGSKHSSYVPVDYTLKKYVRKPKGGAVGTALYTHEKTIHVELKG